MAPVAFEPVGPDVFCFTDTCNVYLVRTGQHGVLIDFGRGEALSRLGDVGVQRLDAVLITHFHRDQLQGLERAVEAGIPVYVPPLERDLIAGANGFWDSRPLSNDYDLRQDRFCLLQGVPVTGWVTEYAKNRFGALEVEVLPTPGHTVGSVSYLVRREGQLLAFTGDLLYGPGQVWSLAATQWSYTGTEGLIASMSSCNELDARRPSALFPSHGLPIRGPSAALGLVQERLQVLADNRSDIRWPVQETYRRPWVALSPHLLRNRSSIAISYALLSGTGKALLIDFGYDVCSGMLGPSDRHARRPLLTSLRNLRESFGAEVEVALPTHYHDDHVAGFNLLREAAGAQIWALPDIAAILESPRRYDLPCLWHDPIPVQRVLPVAQPVRWHEYELTLYPLPGHTLYACAISFEVDGRKVLATGDQQTGGSAVGRNEVLNFQYRNRFRFDDYIDSAQLYRELRPELMISGHWAPVQVTDAYLDLLLQKGHEIADAHRQLLPLEEVDFGAEGFGARIEPYTCEVPRGEHVNFSVWVKNPFRRPVTAELALVVPPTWDARPRSSQLTMAPLGETVLSFDVRPAPVPVNRARIGAELTVDGRCFGQQAEALVSVQ